MYTILLAGVSKIFAEPKSVIYRYYFVRGRAGKRGGKSPPSYSITQKCSYADCAASEGFIT